MKCKLCNQNLVIGSGNLTTEMNTTEVNCKHVFFCINPNCDNYAGDNLNSPDAKVADSIVHKVGDSNEA